MFQFVKRNKYFNVLFGFYNRVAIKYLDIAQDIPFSLRWRHELPNFVKSCLEKKLYNNQDLDVSKKKNQVEERSPRRIGNNILINYYRQKYCTRIYTDTPANTLQKCQHTQTKSYMLTAPLSQLTPGTSVQSLSSSKALLVLKAVKVQHSTIVQ